jgi:peroxiredoxin
LSSLTRLLAQQRREPLSVLAIDVAEVPARVRRFLEMAPVNFPVLLDADRDVTKAWSVTTLPTTYVLDRTLAPRLFVEGDLDWTRTDVVAALEQLGAERN